MTANHSETALTCTASILSDLFKESTAGSIIKRPRVYPVTDKVLFADT